MKIRISAVVAALTLAACGSPEPEVNVGAGVDELANEYLFLELSMGLHNKAHVDAYFGPEAFREAAASEAMSLDDIRLAATDLSGRLAGIDAGDDEMLALRVDGLIERLRALEMRIAINKGEYADFDAESLALFGSQAPQYDNAHFEAILAELDAMVPGDGPLSQRVEAFNAQFAIPLDRLPAVFS